MNQARMLWMLLALTLAAASSLVSGCSTTPDRGNAPQVDDTITSTSSAPVGVIDGPEPPTSAHPPRIGYVKMAPNATCALYYAGNAKPAAQLMSDATGIARFYEPPASWGTQLTVQCTGMADLVVDLTDPSVFSPPAPPPMRVRPALTGDPASYSQAELLAGGYPPPPPAGSPMYGEWLRQVSTTGLVIQQAATAMLGRTNSGQQGYVGQNIWSGPVLAQPYWSGPPYGYVYAEFRVPTVVTNQTYQQYYGSEWVGLGGSAHYQGDPNQYSMPQLGAAFDSNYGCIPFGHTWYCNWWTTYTAWAEYIPAGQENLNLTINGNDLLYVETYPCDHNGNFTMSGPWAYFYEYDYNSSQSYSMYIEQTDTFYGDSAEAIVERPTFYENNNPNDPYWYPLTDFSGGELYFYAVDTNGNDHNMATDNFYNYELCNENPPNCQHDVADWTSEDGVEEVTWTWNPPGE